MDTESYIQSLLVSNPLRESTLHAMIKALQLPKGSQALICLTAKVVLLGIRKSLPLSQYRNLEYLLRGVFLGLPGGGVGHKYSEWANIMRDLWSLTNKMQLSDQIEPDSLTPKLEEFVPGSLKGFLNIDVKENWDKSFGEVLE